MKTKIILCLALVLSFLLTGCATNKPVYPLPSAAFPAPGIYLVQPGDSATRIAKNLCLTVERLSELNPGVDWSHLKIGLKLYYAPEPSEKTWQTTLRAAVTNAADPMMIPYSEPAGTMTYTVPADAAKILESHSSSELMPFLIKLRASQSSWEASTVDEWSIIVRDGLRGTPSVLTNILTDAKGAVISTTEIPVYSYTDNYLQSTGNFTKQLSNILIECQKIKPGMPRAELLKVFTTQGGISTATHESFVYRGCRYIKVDVDFILSDQKQWVLDKRPSDTISKISKPYLEWDVTD